MLGHSLMQYFKETKNGQYQVLATTRRASEVSEEFPLFDFSNIEEGKVQLSHILKRLKPDFVFNCIGVIKQVGDVKIGELTIKINSLLPHIIERLCEEQGSKLIHFSTDCVFSGKAGNYSEASVPDALDLYGRSKLLGEVVGENSLTVRTSIIGHEVGRNLSLVDWFLSQEEKCSGFTKAIYTGFPTIVMAEILETKIMPEMKKGYHGLRHLSSKKINKFDLLTMIARVYGKSIKITPIDEPSIDRSLDSSKLRKELSFEPNSWEEMIETMHKNYKKEYEEANESL